MPLTEREVKKRGLPDRCECGGSMIYEIAFGRTFSACDSCTPVVPVEDVNLRNEPGFKNYDVWVQADHLWIENNKEGTATRCKAPLSEVRDTVDGVVQDGLWVEQVLADLERYVDLCHGVELDRTKPTWHFNMGHEGEHLLNVWRALLTSSGVPKADDEVRRKATVAAADFMERRLLEISAEPPTSGSYASFVGPGDVEQVAAELRKRYHLVEVDGSE